ncbi:MAG: PP2C family protein-serine/threonine phosphatase [Desulfobacterales bacterium]
MNNKNKDDRSEIATLRYSGSLAKTVLNSLSAHIAILDENGVILETNEAWKNFAMENKMRDRNDSIGVNYLKLCDATIGKEAKDARKVAAGIRSVIKGEIKEFLYDYPCHGPDGRHFFYLRSIRVAEKEPIRVVVSHEDITALKLAEKALRKRERERDQLRHSLELAREIQQKLLPKKNPAIAGLDVTGKIIYCDETGGDYYDFINMKDNSSEELGVVVADVVGHGISSALIMASVRSALRQRLAMPGSISQIMTDVNWQMAGDLADSGQFVTLFYLVVDPARPNLKWVRAGHEPALLYDPVADDFVELQGSGMALGVDKNFQYEENQKENISRGSIVVLATDGVWETRNESGQMFGRTAVYDIIRKNSKASADEIMEAIFSRIKNFLKAAKPEDDLTLVVVKVL